MSKKSDDNIEKFFQKAVRQSDTTFRESDWQKMEKLLDAHSVPPVPFISKSGKQILGVIAGVILLSLGVYFLGFNQGEGASKEKESQRLSSVTENEKSSPAGQRTAESSADASLSKGDQAPAVDTKVSTEENLRQDVSAETSLSKGDQTPSVDAKVSTEESLNQDAAAETSSAKEEKTKPIKTKSSAQGGSQRSVSGEESLKAIKTNDPPTVKKSKASVASSGSQLSDKQLTTDAGKSSDGIKRNKTENSSLGALQPTKEESVILDERNAAIEKNTTHEVLGSIGGVHANTELSTPSRNDGEVSVAQTSRNEEGNSNQGESSIESDPLKKYVPSSNVDDSQQQQIAVIAQKDSIEEKAVEKTSEEEIIKEKNSNSFLQRWNVALVVAPDFSVTSLEKISSPGAAFGLMIGYNVAPRIAITAGAIRSFKKYDGYGKDYHPPTGYWKNKTNGVVPDEIAGRCTILEIPLLIQYDLRHTDRSRIYISGGASSYFMSSEAYDYTFHEPNAGASTSWSSTASRSYYFGIGHISVAYERHVGNGFSLGVEPYVKIPFQGIGWSQVNLVTTGIYVNARYRFHKKSL